MRSIPHYIRNSSTTIMRVYTMYRPLRVFLTLGIGMILLGMLPGIRFLYLYWAGHRIGHVQSLILAAILTIVGFLVSMIGLLADLLSCNRKLLEELVYRVRKVEIVTVGNPDAHNDFVLRLNHERNLTTEGTARV